MSMDKKKFLKYLMIDFSNLGKIIIDHSVKIEKENGKVTSSDIKTVVDSVIAAYLNQINKK